MTQNIKTITFRLFLFSKDNFLEPLFLFHHWFISIPLSSSRTLFSLTLPLFLSLSFILSSIPFLLSSIFFIIFLPCFFIKSKVLQPNHQNESVFGLSHVHNEEHNPLHINISKPSTNSSKMNEDAVKYFRNKPFVKYNKKTQKVKNNFAKRQHLAVKKQLLNHTLKQQGQRPGFQGPGFDPNL